MTLSVCRETSVGVQRDLECSGAGVLKRGCLSPGDWNNELKPSRRSVYRNIYLCPSNRFIKEQWCEPLNNVGAVSSPMVDSAPVLNVLITTLASAVLSETATGAAGGTPPQPGPWDADRTDFAAARVVKEVILVHVEVESARQRRSATR